MLQAWAIEPGWQPASDCLLNGVRAGQATFSVRAGSAGTASYTAMTPTASVGLDLTLAPVRTSCRVLRLFVTGSPHDVESTSTMKLLRTNALHLGQSESEWCASSTRSIRLRRWKRSEKQPH